MKPHSVAVSTTDFDSASPGSNPGEAAMPDEFLYRYDGIRYASGIDACGDPLPGKGPREIHLTKYRIIRKTSKGVWIDDYTPKGKFVNLFAKKQFANRSKAEALNAFIARRHTEIRILNSRLEDARTFLRLAERGQVND